jgi:hypothetical protein
MMSVHIYNMNAVTGEEHLQPEPTKRIPYSQFRAGLQTT